MNGHEPESADSHSRRTEYRGGVVLGAIRLIEFGFYTFFWLASIALTLLFLYNVGRIYGFEAAALDTIIAGLYPSTTVTATAVIAAIPWVAICVVATIITVGTIIVTILGNDPVGWLDREIERLKLLCPLSAPGTPTWAAWLECRSRLQTLRLAYWSLALAGLVTVVNILVIFSRLGAGLPRPPLPPPFLPPF